MDTTTASDLFEDFFNIAGAKSSNYPPFNIYRTPSLSFEGTEEGGTDVVLELAVAGFEPDMIYVRKEHVGGKPFLKITGKRRENNSAKETEDKKEYLRRHISGRDFENTFQMDPNLQVKEVEIKNGILSVRMQFVEPEKDVETFKIKLRS